MTRQDRELSGLKVLLGVSAGIAAYRAVDLASKLVQSGSMVRTIMTENATKLVGPKSFEAVTCEPVFTSMWSGPECFRINHIGLGDWADVVVVAPATANMIARMANGICDDLLSTTLCACFSKAIIVAPAMNTNMWNNPAVQKNVSTLGEYGVELVGPAQGRLACGTEGTGRMAEPAEIIEAIKKVARQNRSG